MTAWLDMMREADWWIQSNSFIAEFEHCRWLLHYCYILQMTTNLADTLSQSSSQYVHSTVWIQPKYCKNHAIHQTSVLVWAKVHGTSLSLLRGRCEEFLLYWCKCIAHTLLWKLDSKPLWFCWAVAGPPFNEGLARWILKCTGLDVGFDNVLDVGWATTSTGVLKRVSTVLRSTVQWQNIGSLKMQAHAVDHG